MAGATQPPKKQTNRGAVRKISAYFMAQPGVSVSVEQLLAELQLDRRAVQAAIYYLRSQHNFDIATVVAGEVYRYDPPKDGVQHATRGQHLVRPSGPEPAPKQKPSSHGSRMFEQVGTTRSGELLLQDEDDQFYLARQL